MPRLILTSLLSFCLSATAFADIVIGKVVDASNGEPIPFASFTLSQRTAAMTTTMSGTADSLGNIRTVAGFGSARLEVEALGYYPARHSITATGGIFEGDTLDVGVIALKPSEVFMDEALVVANERKFVMHGDTVVFNPRAFKLQQGARLDELIQKLPGVAVRDGKLYWNNKPLRIMMNGEELFMGAEQLTQMLPVEAVENIKTYNKASDFAEKAGRDDGKEDQVLDVNIKKGFLDKWYGDLKAAYQTADKGELEVDAFKLSTHDPLMLYLDVNNLNAITNFKNFGGSSSSSNMDFSKQHYGSFGYKHQFDTTQGTQKLRRQVWVSGSLGHNDRSAESRTLQETYFPGTDHTFRLGRTYSYTHTLNPTLYFGLSADLDSLWRLRVNADAGYKKQEIRTKNSSAVYDTDAYALSDDPLDAAFRTDAPNSLRRHLVNSTKLAPLTETEGTNANISMTLTRWLRNNAHIELKGSVSYENEESRRYQQNNYQYYREPERTRTDVQYDNAPTHALNTKWGLTYETWLGKKVLFNTSYKISHQKGFEKDFLYLSNNDLDRQTFFSLPADALDSLFDRSNSMSNSYATTSHILDAGWLIKLGKVSLIPALTYERRHETSGYYRGAVDTAVSRNTNIWTPAFDLRWKIAKGHNFTASYTATENLPELVSTIAFRDESNPMDITEGNPDLRSSWMHRANIIYNAAITKNAHSISTSLEYTKDTRPTQTVFYYNEKTGVYRSRPENVRGTDKWSFSIADDITIKEVFNIRNDLSLIHKRSYGYLTAMEGATPLLNRQKSFALAYKPYLAYEQKRLRISASADIAYRYDDNSEGLSVGNHFWNVLISYTASYNWKNFEVGTVLRDRFAHGYSLPEMNRHNWVWGASASWRCLKGKGRLELEADDILNKDNSFDADLSAYQRTETHYYYPHHYLQLSFTYHFDAKGDKKQGRR